MAHTNKEATMEERFMYTVVPRRPIRNLIKGKVITRSENLLLSKEEVLMCLKFGAVYRKFYLDSNLEKVAPSNLDRLHRSIHLNEAQYNSLMRKEFEEETDVKDPESEITHDEPVVSETDSVVDDTVEEQPEEKKDVEEQLPTEDEVVEDPVVDVHTEDVTADVIVNNIEQESSYPAKKKSGKKANKKPVPAVQEEPKEEVEQ